MTTATPVDPWVKADWPTPPGIHALVTLRHGAGGSQPPFDSFNLGTRCGDDARVVQANRAELIARCALPSAPYWLHQVHGIDIVRFDPEAALRPQPEAGPEPNPEPEADAAVTSTPGVVLAILTADCLPVVMAAQDGSEIGAAHAGWRGLSDGVLEATVGALRTPASDLLVWLGPAAGPRVYEVGQEVYDAFVTRDVQAQAAFVATRPGHWRADLYALARLRLAAAGVVRVFGGGQCTISNPRRYYSYRRDQRCGRMATLIWREHRTQKTRLHD